MEAGSGRLAAHPAARVFWLATAACVAALGVVLAPPWAAATDELQNAGFESWNAGAPSGWMLAVGTNVTQDTGAIGAGARIGAAPSGTALLADALPVSPGTTASGSVEFTGVTATAGVGFRWLNDNFVPLSTPLGPHLAAGPGWATVSADSVVPAGAAWVQLVLSAKGSGTVTFDNAALVLTAPLPPTATPTPLDSPTATPVNETPTAEATETPPSPAGATPTATSTSAPGATSTKTPTPTRTPTGTRTPSPTREPTSTRTPTPRPASSGSQRTPLPTSTPTLSAGSGFGGLVANGDFELVSDGKPAYWEKFGGVMVASGDAARGAYAGCLQSETASTKWLYQIVEVEGGGWYAAGAKGRMVGGGSASIRVSWYESFDGSGSQMDSVESNVTSGGGWATLTTGPIQAPTRRVRHECDSTVQPAGNATACFDDATFFTAEAPPATAQASGTTPQSGATAAKPPNTPRPGATSRSTSTSNSPVRGVPGAAAPSRVPIDGSTALRISEVLSDPVEPGRDAAFEWVEIVNVGEGDLDTSGWLLADGNTARALPQTVIPAGGYFVVRGESAQLATAVPAGISAGGEIGNGLGNTGDVLRLTAPGGQVADELSFGDNTDVFDPAPEAPGPGETVGVVDPRSDPASENWATTLRPTPGEPNVFPPPPVAAVAGEFQPAASESGEEPSAEVEVEEQGGGSSIVPWLVLGAAGGLSLGVGAAKLGPRFARLRNNSRAS